MPIHSLQVSNGALDCVADENSISIKVRLSGHLRRFGISEREFTLPHSAKVRDVLLALADSVPELRPVLFGASDALNAQLLLFVDDEQTYADQVLTNARSLTLMLPISGG